MLLAMNHQGHGASFGTWGWLVLAGTVLLVLLLAALAYSRVRQSDGLSRSERRELDPMEAEILAILRQTGGPMAQSGVGELILADSDDIAQAVHGLEARGLVQREWSSQQQTYMLSPT